MIFQSAGRNVFGDFSQLLQKSMHPETAKYFIWTESWASVQHNFQAVVSEYEGHSLA